MSRLLEMSAAFLTLGCACALYAATSDTLQPEAPLQSSGRQAERLEADIAALAVERARRGGRERSSELERASATKQPFGDSDGLPNGIVTGAVPPAALPSPRAR